MLSENMECTAPALSPEPPQHNPLQSCRWGLAQRGTMAVQARDRPQPRHTTVLCCSFHCYSLGRCLGPFRPS